jgi:Bacterial regulatory helix-turn-helix protein, lysR family
MGGVKAFAHRTSSALLRDCRRRARKLSSSCGGAWRPGSTISRRVRDLEDEIGAALFIRSNGGVHLTYAGHRFVVRARKAIGQVGRAAKDVGAIGRDEEGVVRIGIFSSLASGFLAELIQAYNASHSGVRLEFIEFVAAQTDRYEALANSPFVENRPSPEPAKLLKDELLFQRATL